LKTLAASELPPPRLEPLARGSAEFDRLRAAQRALAHELLGDEGVFAVFATGTKVDVGSWLGSSRVCVAALADELVLFAPARSLLSRLPAWAPLASVRSKARPYVERIGFGDLGDSAYNHVTGELILAPAPSRRVRRLRLAALDGYQLLAQIHPMREERRDA